MNVSRKAASSPGARGQGKGRGRGKGGPPQGDRERKATQKRDKYLQIAPFVESLKLCARNRDLQRGASIHQDIRATGLLPENHPLLANTLISMYAKCGALDTANEVLQGLSCRNVVSWSAMISGYVQQGRSQDAMDCFERMQRDGISPNEFTYACILKACGNLGDLEKARALHADVQGLLQGDVVLGNALVDMYVKCGDLSKAQEVLEGLSERNVISWSSLIAGYAQQGSGQEALDCYDRMIQQDGFSPNAITYTCILKACGSVAALDRGKKIHEEIDKQGLLRRDIVLGNSLVDMYAKCGALTTAREVLDWLPRRDAISWSALIAGYVQQGLGQEALDCFEQMRKDGLSPCSISYTCALKACAGIGALEKGEQIHREILNKRLLQKDVMLGNALVDMYAKCGALPKAEEVLESLSCQDAGMWTALIAGHALHGNSHSVLRCFERMEEKGLPPDEKTFSCVLNACSHSGLIDESQMYFTRMRAQYGLVPTVEHFTCMVDLFGRAGHFEKAVAVIDEMPSSKHIAVWSALLGACQKWDNLEVGIWAFENAIQIDKNQPSLYVCMSNIYAAAGRNEEARKIEAMRALNEAERKPQSAWWTDEAGLVHSFCVGDTEHPQSKRLYAKLKVIGRKMLKKGYTPSSPDKANPDLLCAHSEMLAIACAHINTPKGSPIRIATNMHVSGGCHSMMCLVSKLEKREIAVGDANLLHVFKDGKCSCGDNG